MLYHNMGTISSRPFYLPWVAFREYGDWCDSLGNLLAILTGVADGHRTEHILRYMRQVGMAEPYPTKAIYPPIFPGESELARLLSQPQPEPAPPISQRRHLAHDRRAARGRAGASRLVSRGGEDAASVWRRPIGRASTSSGSSTSGCTASSGHPMGYAQQAWSAAMYLYADHAVHTGKLLLFDDLRAAKPASAVAAEVNDFYVQSGGGPV